MPSGELGPEAWAWQIWVMQQNAFIEEYDCYVASYTDWVASQQATELVPNNSDQGGGIGMINVSKLGKPWCSPAKFGFQVCFL